MKLARLLLQAYGPFTDAEIDFTGNRDRAAAALHLIYGPNEAGKSSALRAMTDLRFGIPLRSPDDFVHRTKDLRIAGVFIDAEGAPLGLVRRKGRGTTLSRFDVETGEPSALPEVRREQASALTGGLERAEFEAMFGLNHGRLRAGGDLLLKGEGELGSALFEASAGTRGIVAILAALDTDAKQLYNPHGRSQNATINLARRQLDEQRHLWKQAQIKPADWQALNRAHQQANAVLAELDQILESMRRQENELTELRTVSPLLSEHDRAQAELRTLVDIPDLPDNAREDRLGAQQALRRARTDLADAELELRRCAEALDGLVIEASLLAHANAVERLAAGVEAASHSRIEVRRQQAVIERIGVDLAVAAARIAPGKPVEAVLNAAPSEADRVALENHLAQISRLDERLDGYRNRVEQLEQAAKLGADQATTVPDPVARRKLVAALQEAQGLGDLSRHTTELDRDIRGQHGELTRTLTDLGVESAEALGHARPLLDAQISGARKQLNDFDEAVRTLHDEDLRLDGDLEQQRLRQRQLAAEGEVVTAETLRLARKRRDCGWMMIRQAYVERSRNADELSLTFDPDRSLPEAFEAAQGDADRQSDLLRADAARAAGFEECAARIEAMEKRRHEIADALTMHAARRREHQHSWSKQLAHACLPDLEPDALREWQSARLGAVDIAARLAKAQADRDRLLTDMNTAVSALAAALQAVGEAPQSLALTSLIMQAARWERHATALEAEHNTRAEAQRNQAMEREKLGGQISKTLAVLHSHTTPVQAWHARLFLAADSAPDAVKARLDELDHLNRQSLALSEARLRQSQQQAVIDDVANQAAQLAMVLGEPVPQMVDDFSDRLRKRLAVSREQEQQRLVLVRDRKRAQETKQRAEATQSIQTAVLARLCAAAEVETVEQLPEREDSAGRKRLLQDTLAAQRQQLARASSRSEQELRERLAGRDMVAIESERRRCRQEIVRLQQEQTAGRQMEEQTRRALEAIDASDKAATAREALESAAARYRSALRPWARLRLAHALLHEALNRFRERAQAPMVAAASTYFSLMTGGRYQRLVTEEAGDKPVLRAERADGARIGVEAMSDGTADQLYLSLRLAALDLRNESPRRMPLVLDDVLVTSDDERAANVLKALARFAEGGQVMLFTHHRHLIDVARGSLAEHAFAVHSL